MKMLFENKEGLKEADTRDLDIMDKVSEVKGAVFNGDGEEYPMTNNGEADLDQTTYMYLPYDKSDHKYTIEEFIDTFVEDYEGIINDLDEENEYDKEDIEVYQNRIEELNKIDKDQMPMGILGDLEEAGVEITFVNSGNTFNDTPPTPGYAQFEIFKIYDQTYAIWAVNNGGDPRGGYDKESLIGGFDGDAYDFYDSIIFDRADISIKFEDGSRAKLSLIRDRGAWDVEEIEADNGIANELNNVDFDSDYKILEDLIDKIK